MSWVRVRSKGGLHQSRTSWYPVIIASSYKVAFPVGGQVASNETWWTGWACHKDKFLWFWWRSENGSGHDNYLIYKVILHHWEIGQKLCHIFEKCIGLDMFLWIRQCVAELCAPPSALLVHSVHVWTVLCSTMSMSLHPVHTKKYVRPLRCQYQENTLQNDVKSNSY